jgi:hypothetical protein
MYTKAQIVFRKSKKPLAIKIMRLATRRRAYVRKMRQELTQAVLKESHLC